MIWFAADNGPEINCPPTGVCQQADTNPSRPVEGPGSADIYEGGHRVAGIVSIPGCHTHRHHHGLFRSTAHLSSSHGRWMEEASCHCSRIWNYFYGKILHEDPRGFGIGYLNANASIVDGWGHRFGRWKFVEGSASCKEESCRKPELFNLETDLGERHDL
jgi:hypothetical protein